MIDAVIFDMDGLLIDSEPFWREAEISVFGKHGISLTEDDCRKTTGMRVDEVIRHWSGLFPEAKLNETLVLNEIMEGVSSLVIEKGKALPGVYDLIHFFKTKNLPMAVASASNYSLIYTVVKKLEIEKEFQVIQSAEKLDYGKPHPDVFITTAKKLNVKPENCLVFEDSLFGVLAGKAAKMKVVAVPEKENYKKIEFVIANAKIPTLEYFNDSMYKELQ